MSGWDKCSGAATAGSVWGAAVWEESARRARARVLRCRSEQEAWRNPAREMGSRARTSL